MKKLLSIFIVCSMLFLISVGTTTAGNPDYSIIEYTGGITLATVDGVWTTPDEWNDALTVPISSNATFWYYAEINVFNVEMCVEIFSDNTTDAEDYWQFCFDDGNTGGTAPSTGDYRIDIIGHTDVVIYTGNGTGWSQTELTPADIAFTWANQLSDSPIDSNPHWILEVSFVKTTALVPSAPPTGLRVAVYDASNPEDGVQDWAPDSDVNVPDEWGLVASYSADPIPEGLTFAVMAILSSVALLAGSHYLRKRSKKLEN